MTETLYCCPICGETEAAQVTTRDRYGEPYALWLCAGCAVLYANPRRTGEEAREWYASGAYREQYGTEEATHPLQSVIATTLSGFLRSFLIRPKRVFEYGCGRGDWLVELREAFGCEVYGGELDPAMAPLLRERGIPPMSLEAGHADLIVANHYLEHVLNPVEWLRLVKLALAPGGHIFVAVPGLHTWNLAQLWQSAHTFQFTLASLTELMRRCGLVPVYGDEMVTSLWRREEDAAPSEAARIMRRLTAAPKERQA